MFTGACALDLNTNGRLRKDGGHDNGLVSKFWGEVFVTRRNDGAMYGDDQKRKYFLVNDIDNVAG